VYDAPSELVSLPGAYSDSDPGIFDPNVFNPGASYTFPGPPIASFVAAAGGASGNSNSSSTSGSAPSGTGAAAPATSTTASGKTCTIKKRALSNTEAADLYVVRPRHFSRIMRRLAQNLH
jgi:hypothetical protein